MRELRTEIEIIAPPGVVWTVLTDLDNYADWNPFITAAEGYVRVGEQLSVHIEPPGGRAMTFRPTVTVARENEEFRWLGKLIVRGLFDGEHIFEIHRVDDARVKFVQREVFGGLLLPVLWKSLQASTRAGFEAMNTELKERAESFAD